MESIEKSVLGGNEFPSDNILYHTTHDELINWLKLAQYNYTELRRRYQDSLKTKSDDGK